MSQVEAAEMLWVLVVIYIVTQPVYVNERPAEWHIICQPLSSVCLDYRIIWFETFLSVKNMRIFCFLSLCDYHSYVHCLFLCSFAYESQIYLFITLLILISYIRIILVIKYFHFRPLDKIIVLFGPLLCQFFLVSRIAYITCFLDARDGFLFVITVSHHVIMTIIIYCTLALLNQLVCLRMRHYK